MIPTLFWIPGPWRGRLAVAARPRGGDWLEGEALGWRRAGVDVVVSLLEQNEAHELGLDREKEAAEANGIHFVSFPIPDRGTPKSTQGALSLLKNIERLLRGGKSVAVHCRQGLGRSGLIAAGALIGGGVSVENAIHAVSAARGETVPETAEQLRWIQGLPSEDIAVAS
jgi:protein-tyrosine phosphatase